VTIHSRDTTNIDYLQSMHAGHGMECEPPPDTHPINTYEEAVFTCRDHVMTAINDSGYGVIYLAPDHLVDFSEEEAVIRFDVSTERTSMRDWIDIWITPYEDHLQLPLTEWLPDLSGEPRRSIQVEMSNFNNSSPFKVYVTRDFRVEEVKGVYWIGYEEFLTPSVNKRETFELRISKNHIMFGMPDYDFWWVDTDIAPLDWSQGVVQFGHHSYNPTKDCSSCAPNTWHWDNIYIKPSIPFTIIRTVERYANAKTNPVISLSAPAPSGGNLRFAGMGKGIEVSFDGGNTWELAQVQKQKNYSEGVFWSYWTPVPAGTTKISFRGQATWAGDWHVRDISVWSREGSPDQP
jgi:hypothetical protein